MIGVVMEERGRSRRVWWQQTSLGLKRWGVALGAIARGRSGSQSLNRELRRLLPWILGKNLHVGGFHMPTWAIRADEVSRFYELRPPRCPLPNWLLQVAAHGPSEATDDLLEKRSWTPKSWGRWLRLGSVVLARVRADDPWGTHPRGARGGPFAIQARRRQVDEEDLQQTR